MSQNQQPQQPQQPQFNGDDMNKAGYVTLRCPKCGSPNIEFVTEYHKSILGRFVVFIMLIATAAATISGFTAYDKLEFDNFWIAIVVGVFTAIIYIRMLLAESKTHVKGICRTCGHTWDFS